MLYRSINIIKGKFPTLLTFLAVQKKRKYASGLHFRSLRLDELYTSQREISNRNINVNETNTLNN